MPSKPYVNGDPVSEKRLLAEIKAVRWEVRFLIAASLVANGVIYRVNPVLDLPQALGRVLSALL